MPWSMASAPSRVTAEHWGLVANGLRAAGTEFLIGAQVARRRFRVATVDCLICPIFEDAANVCNAAFAAQHGATNLGRDDGWQTFLFGNRGDLFFGEVAHVDEVPE